jgi:hypothetical protein
VAARKRRGARVATLLAACAAVAVLLACSPALAQPATTTTTVPVDPTVYNQGCFTCHSLPTLGTVEVDGTEKSLFVSEEIYKNSVHGQLACSSCHIGFSHDPHAVVPSSANFAQIAGDACKNCHANEYSMYEQSYHGTLKQGESAEGKQAPGCVDCHGSHDVKSVTSPGYRKDIDQICGRCHGGREKTYLDTYHGQAITLGRDAVATCTDCHGNHTILPQSNPQSTISDKNILATCQKCHPTATENFTTYLVHVTPTSPGAPALVFWVTLFYIVLIASVFTFGGTHTILYIYRGIKDRSYSRRKGGH